jgi:hypothetical protein
MKLSELNNLFESAKVDKVARDYNLNKKDVQTLWNTAKEKMKDKYGWGGVMSVFHNMIKSVKEVNAGKYKKNDIIHAKKTKTTKTKETLSAKAKKYREEYGVE